MFRDVLNQGIQTRQKTALIKTCSILSAFGLYFILILLAFDINPEVLSEKKEEIVEIHDYPNIQNSQFEYDLIQPFQIDDTDALQGLKRIVKAVPSNVGYTVEEGNRIFPPFEYPDWIELGNVEPEEGIVLDYTQGVVNITCPMFLQPGHFTMGPIENITFTNPNELKQKWEIHNPLIEGDEKITEQTDWAIGECGKPKRLERYNLYTHYTRRNDTVHERGLQFQSQNQVHKKPLIILTLGVDSFSRRHFFRKMPETIQFLNDLKNGAEYAVFDFKFHNIIGDDTAENMSKVFGTRFLGYSKSRQNRSADRFQDTALWTKLRKIGFATLLGFDGCAYKMNKMMGWAPAADHVSETFFCAAYRFSRFDSDKHKAHEQRCLGDHMYHWYLMNYTLSFSENYRGSNQWAYNHFTAAHEISGQHAQTLDKDLKWYLQEYIKKFSADHELFIMIAGDHGMRYGEFLSGTAAIQEHRMPAFFVITSHSYVSEIPYVYDILTHNTYRLSTKPDLRKTTLWLARHHLGLPDEPDDEINELQYNFLTEKVNDNRTCAESGIPAWFCSTNILEVVDNRIYNQTAKGYESRRPDEIASEKLFLDIANSIITVANEETRLPVSFSVRYLCELLTVSELEQVLTSVISETEIIVKLTIKVHQDESFRLDAWLLVTPHHMAETPPMMTKNHRPFPIIYNSKAWFGKIIEMKRLDEYRSNCEELARDYQIDPQLWVWDEPFAYKIIAQDKAKAKKRQENSNNK